MDVVGRVPPVDEPGERSELEPERRIALCLPGTARDALGDESGAPQRRLMVVEDADRCVHLVSLPIEGAGMRAGDLGDRVRVARSEGGRLVLPRSGGVPENLGGARVKDGATGRVPPDRFQEVHETDQVDFAALAKLY